MLLAGDIGGTKTVLAIYSSEQGLRAPLLEKTFHSGNYGSLEKLVQEFLAQTRYTIDRACFGVAGPVVERRATITNLPWIMEEGQLERTLDIPSVRLLNDLVASAHGVFTLLPSDLHTLNQGEPHERGAIAVVAPGTGLGEAYMTWNGSHYQVHPSEGGHADFAPSNPLEADLLRYLFTRYPHVSYERICSGIGIPNIYTFLRDTHVADEPSWLAQQLAEASDPTPIIMNAAVDTTRSSEICVETANTFVSVLGAEAGNMALKVLATGGIYLGGGIPPRIIPLLNAGRFMTAFKRKGRFTPLLERIPVHVILNPKIALLGAANYGFAMQPGEDKSRVPNHRIRD